MNPLRYHTVTGLIFAAIALAHAVRLAYGWRAEIGGWEVPLSLSWAALLVAAYLAYQGLRLGKKR